MVFDLAKGKFSWTSMPWELDISDFEWLDDDHLVCNLIRDRRVPEATLDVDIHHLGGDAPEPGLFPKRTDR